MNLIERAKNILIKPKEEWLVIDQENTSVSQLVTGYLIPLAFIPAIAVFIRYGLIGFGPFAAASFSLGIKYAVVSFVSTIGGVYLSALSLMHYLLILLQQKIFVNQCNWLYILIPPCLLQVFFKSFRRWVF